jgi:hypothetical protein
MGQRIACQHSKLTNKGRYATIELDVSFSSTL